MLIKCVDCGNSVSDRASACPQCGGQMPVKPVSASVKFSLILDIGLVFFGWMLLTQSTTDRMAFFGLAGMVIGIVELVWTKTLRRWWTSG